ncbi:hypothetical protein BDN70DRAFT_117943 [Pholiota conissans]|uniref:Uncharacterized protein n=1 Tax=Pholiota conissans TaxID=109636 RepID=A0A9P5YWS6_9AGAR|nr:hypothetical protein BDN70DRAFT_117943 [Pholiota conissans]
MLSSFTDTVRDFFVTGFLSLAIVLATIRAHTLKLPVYLESNGISEFLLVSLLITISACVYLVLSRRQFCNGDDQKDEELGLSEDIPTRSRQPIIHALPVILDWGRGRRPTRNVIRLEGDGSSTN